MKRGATREEIIRTTQELISRNGIRAVRVDEIAQTLGISKRTLYTMFADKNELVNACLPGRQLFPERCEAEARLCRAVCRTPRSLGQGADLHARKLPAGRIYPHGPQCRGLCRKACKLALRDAHQPGIARGAAAHLPGPASGRRHAGGHRPHRPELMLRHTGHSVPGRI